MTKEEYISAYETALWLFKISLENGSTDREKFVRAVSMLHWQRRIKECEEK